MTSRRFSTAHLGGLVGVLTTLALIPGVTQIPAVAAPASSADAPASISAQTRIDPEDLVTLGDPVAGLADLDVRGRVLPTLTQRRSVAALGSVSLRWNDFGTPASILPRRGSLGKARSSDPVRAARLWLGDHASLFGLSKAAIGGLELVNSQELVGSPARAVLFRQRFGSLAPALGSMVTVGVARGQIAYVSSSLTRTTSPPPEARISPTAGWVAAAANVGRGLPTGELAKIVSTVSDGWTRLTVPGFAQQQQVRLRALALADGSVRPVLEANVVDVRGGSTTAYTVLVDAVTAKVLYRANRVKNSNDAFPFAGSVTATECGPRHPFKLSDAKTRTIAAVAVAANPNNDLVVKIFDPHGQLLVAGDLGTSPETATYTAESIPAGTYTVQACPFDAPTTPFLPPGNYSLNVVTTDQGASTPGTSAPNPRWRFFPTNPVLDYSGRVSRGDVVGCWLAARGCNLPSGSLTNVQAPGPWDFLTATQTPSFTTNGNNAVTHEAWANPLAPGGLAQAPVSPTQSYTTPFTDAWNNSKCDPTQLRPGGNDINFTVGNLFVNHNRMHDFAYYLGFNERNYNLQLDNLGRGGLENDPEIGNAQAGALTGGQPTTLGRDNANQIALQDGVPGITNQYLFQPLAGAFYSPCADGDLDMSIVGHEYTHAISNRMVGGPDEGLTSEQGGAMGESWSDLVASEYIFSHNYSTGTRPWVVGPYATGNKVTGIRDYAIDRNPLNYSDYGFDSTGDEVHADGEIWNGVQWELRQALVQKWDRLRGHRYRSSKKPLQLKCAEAGRNKGVVRPQQCPGNRRWLQLIFDSFLMQQGATSMLDARDATIAADKMRFRGENNKILWQAFARRGMGGSASTPTADSGDVKPSFASPVSKNVKVRFKTKAPGRIYVGDWEARATPVADTIKKTKRGSATKMTPGRYRMLFVSPKHGFKRFTLKVKAPRGKRGRKVTHRIRSSKNYAARATGAKVIKATAGSRNPGSLIDGTEATNWGGVTEANVDASHPFVAVDLAGKKPHRIRRIQVSAMLNPAPASDDPIPLAADPDSGSRFTALRRFAVEACTRRCGSTKARWKRVYTSRKNAFPSLRPRPVAPTINLRSFKIKPTRASALRLITLENQCTGYAGYAGEQDNDPLNDTDCKTASDRGTIVHAAEFQAF